jgi:hypothetical protein
MLSGNGDVARVPERGDEVSHPRHLFRRVTEQGDDIGADISVTLRDKVEDVDDDRARSAI